MVRKPALYHLVQRLGRLTGAHSTVTFFNLTVRLRTQVQGLYRARGDGNVPARRSACVSARRREIIRTNNVTEVRNGRRYRDRWTIPLFFN